MKRLRLRSVYGIRPLSGAEVQGSFRKDKDFGSVYIERNRNAQPTEYIHLSLFYQPHIS